MGVDCDCVSGIGVSLDDVQWPEELEKLYIAEFEDEDGWLKEADSFGDDNYILEEFLKGTCIYLGESGSYYSGETYLHLFANDPVNGLDQFVKDMNRIGFEITRDNLEFISETLWS